MEKFRAKQVCTSQIAFTSPDSFCTSQIGFVRARWLCTSQIGITRHHGCSTALLADLPAQSSYLEEICPQINTDEHG